MRIKKSKSKDEAEAKKGKDKKEPPKEDSAKKKDKSKDETTKKKDKEVETNNKKKSQDEPVKKKTKKDNEVIGYDRGLKLEKILGATDANGELMFLIKWENLEEPDLVPSRITNVKDPQTVIKFYEERLNWHNDSDDEW